MFLIFDTETTGLPKSWSAPISDTENWPRCIQIAWQLHDANGKLLESQDFLIKPVDFNIPFDSQRIHGISTDLAAQNGVLIEEVLAKFNQALSKADYIIGQNVGFDVNIVGCEFYRLGIETPLVKMPVLDTCTETTAQLLKLPGGRGGKFKLPTLTELHEYLFQAKFNEAHNATADVEATTRCFFALLKQEIFTKDEFPTTPGFYTNLKENYTETDYLCGKKHVNLKQESEKLALKLQKQLPNGVSLQNNQTNLNLDTVSFVHLHNHSQFSILQSTISIPDLVQATINNKMPAVALTDFNNLMGAFQFVNSIIVHNKLAKSKNEIAVANGETPTETEIKPIVGCEFNICTNHKDKSNKDNGYQVVLIAKNKKGYHNLAKLSSKAFTDGFYYVPRIDKELLLEYKSDLIVLTGSIYGEVPNKILNIGENQAEEALLWWKEHFNEDLYLELMRHNQPDEDVVNDTLLKFSKKHNIKLVATNNSFYIKKDDANAHDILLCVKDGEKQATPIGRGRGYRFGLPNQEYYFKDAQEMKAVFADIPEALLNIQEIVDKIETYSLAREVLLPKFDIPKEFIFTEDETDGGKRGENKYLEFLTFEGAKKRYQVVTLEIKERLDFELKTIEKTGYPGYFLIVQDFIAAARRMGVSVGPGRGSAAGSAVAYCLGITNIDPIEYDLLFERFLNPDRVSMPDIDIDFDDEGRGKVMDYVIDKYGSNQVAQIITYGKMATKSAIRDTARVLDLPLFEADRIAKLIPAMMPSKWNLARFLSEKEDEVKKALRPDEFERVKELIAIANLDELSSETIQQAKVLEGSLRNTGIHACGVIITPDDITNFVPVVTAKDSELYVTQFDNAVAESAGLLKMDFLGLKTLTLIKDTVKLVKYIHNIDLDPDSFPIHDIKTYELFQRGETVGIFQYESTGMQKYLRELKPTVFGDLIAMNALYRPGPLEYIPSFIRRKNGEEAITYDLDACQEYLSETYGITVYQEQVMLLSQSLAGFTKGDADVLRKAMGKKDRPVLDKMKPKFIEQASAKGHNETILEKIWKDWEAFASYAFNKSHSTCYAWIAYQTAYLKAHYAAEYMAAVLSNNMNDIKSVSFFMEECKRMGLHVLGPDVNESFYKFTVNKIGAIRFGMGAIKGVGEGAVNTIVECRKKGKFKSIFDLAKRIDLRAANKKAFENLALAGGFDCFENTHRAQYFFNDGDGLLFLEKAMKYGAKAQENENASQGSLFGDSVEVQIPEPALPTCQEWSTMEKLSKEKEVVGIYISGHPLDDFKFQMTYFCNNKLEILKNLSTQIGKNINFGGIVTNVQHRTSKTGKGWATFNLEGYDESFEFRIFNEEYLKYRHFLLQNQFVFVKVFVKEGWTNKETGKKSDPLINFIQIESLHDVLKNLAKKLILKLNIKTINFDLVTQLQTIFNLHKGNFPVSFEINELQKIQKEVVNILQEPEIESDVIIDDDSDLDIAEINLNNQTLATTTIEEEAIINQINLQSRKVKVEISTEMLEKLHGLGVDFSLN